MLDAFCVDKAFRSLIVMVACRSLFHQPVKELAPVFSSESSKPAKSSW